MQFPNTGDILHLPLLGDVTVHARQNGAIIVTSADGTGRRIPNHALPFFLPKHGEESLTLDEILRNRLDDLFEYALSPQGSKAIELPLGSITDDEAASIQRQTSIAVKGMNFSIDTSAIRHTMGRHGGARVGAEGQIPITKADFVLIPELLANPDYVVRGGQSKQGLETLRFIKRGVGYYVYVAEVRRGRRNIAAITLYKFERGKGGLELSVPTPGGTPPLGDADKAHMAAPDFLSSNPTSNIPRNDVADLAEE